MSATITLDFKPMISAPRDEGVSVLVLDEWYEAGQLTRSYKLVHWNDAWDGEPGGWYADNGNRCNPQGWVLSTDHLPSY